MPRRQCGGVPWELAWGSRSRLPFFCWWLCISAVSEFLVLVGRLAQWLSARKQPYRLIHGVIHSFHFISYPGYIMRMDFQVPILKSMYLVMKSLLECFECRMVQVSALQFVAC